MRENEIAKAVVHLCYEIHNTYGPGLYERVYEKIVCYELQNAGIPFKQQCPIPVVHKVVSMGIGFRADLIVDDLLLVELKAVEEISKVHRSQVLNYLKLADLKLGLLINFNVALIKNGMHRIANDL